MACGEDWFDTPVLAGQMKPEVFVMQGFAGEDEHFLMHATMSCRNKWLVSGRK